MTNLTDDELKEVQAEAVRLISENADLKRRLDTMADLARAHLDQRDEALAKLENAYAGGQDDAKKIDRIEADNATLRAEAAALREASESCLKADRGWDLIIRDALSQPGPGARLLERYRKLEAVAEAAEEFLYTPDNIVDLNIAKAILAEAVSKFRGK